MWTRLILEGAEKGHTKNPAFGNSWSYGIGCRCEVLGLSLAALTNEGHWRQFAFWVLSAYHFDVNPQDENLSCAEAVLAGIWCSNEKALVDIDITATIIAELGRATRWNFFRNMSMATTNGFMRSSWMRIISIYCKGTPLKCMTSYCTMPASGRKMKE